MKLLVATIVGMTIGSAHAEMLLGRWCDKPVQSMPTINSIIGIQIKDTGEPLATLEFGDGSIATRELKEESSTVYSVVGSRHGDRYRIVESTGGLQLIDNDGIIRVAKRLENKPVPNECGFLQLEFRK